MKFFQLTLFLLLLFVIPAFAHDTQCLRDNAVDKGISLGSAIAIVTSWSRNKSVRWAILHAIFSWLYVIHFVLTRRQGE